MKIRWRKSFFGQLFIALLGVSVIPVLFISILLDALFYDTLNQYTLNEGEQTVQRIYEEINALMEENIEIINFLSQEHSVIQGLKYKGNDKTIKTLINQYMIGNKNKIEIHILSANKLGQFTSSHIPNIYNYDVYKEWGIFKEVGKVAPRVAFYPNKYKSIEGKDIILSMSKQVVDEDGSLLGYVIVDNYREPIYEIIRRNTVNLQGRYTLVYGGKDTVINTGNQYLEGLRLSEQEQIYIRRLGESYQVPLKLEDKKSMLMALPLTEYNMLLIYEVDKSIWENHRGMVKSIVIWIGTISIFCSICITFILFQKFTEPIKTLQKGMEEIGEGKFEAKVPISKYDELSVLGRGFNQLTEKILQLLREKITEERELKQAQINALQAQINPHFLYNTLATIKSLAGIYKAPEISQIVINLSKLLRSNIHFSSEMVTIQQEVELIEAYLQIQNIRFNNKFVCEIDISETIMQKKIQRFILQPIVENAILHGLEKKVGKGNLWIRGYLEDKKIIIEVKDDGIGMSKEKLEEFREAIYRSNETGKSIGMMNVNRRLQLLYGQDYGLEMESEKSVGTCIWLKIG